VLALLIGAAIWYGTRGQPIGESSPPVHTAGPGSAGPSGPTSGRTPGSCVFTVFDPAARCPGRAECFDELAVDDGVARAATLPCDSTHTWETFVLGTLPDSVESVAHDEVKEQPGVRSLCTEINLLAIAPDLEDWRVDVLPPTPEAFEQGDRTFRCLGGKGRDGLAEQALHTG
jgi:eukaryotic-like serine/threonine-protein kinase